MSLTDQAAQVNSSLKCKNCGATLQFEPGKHSLICSYCGVENEIAASPAADIHSFDYNEFIAGNISPQSTMEKVMVKCGGCGASVDLPPGVTSDNCPFCASPLVISLTNSVSILKPHYVLPFIIDTQTAQDAFKKWMKDLWFAPSDLIKKVNDGSSRQLQGIYVPYWSYDTDVVTNYSGNRGDAYYTTETYTVSENGEDRTETREVRHINWTPVSGTISVAFEDVLVSASPSLPQKIADTLQPWQMDKLEAFDERYLSGFRSETYQTDAAAAFETAKREMDPAIRNAINRDIGGDEQSILSYQNNYNDTALKYILLPVWLSAYRYNEKLYHFVVNACTGHVAGERPYSAPKIILAVLFGLAVLVALYFMLQNK